MTFSTAFQMSQKWAKNRTLLKRSNSTLLDGRCGTELTGSASRPDNALHVGGFLAGSRDPREARLIGDLTERSAAVPAPRAATLLNRFSEGDFLCPPV